MVLVWSAALEKGSRWNMGGRGSENTWNKGMQLSLESRVVCCSPGGHPEVGDGNAGVARANPET